MALDNEKCALPPMRHLDDYDLDRLSFIGTHREADGLEDEKSNQQPTRSCADDRPDIWHRIEEGDTFYQLALTHCTTIEDLKRMNPGVDASKLTIGELINVGPGCIREDYKIAYKSGVALEKLLELNPHIKDRNKIYPGHRLRLHE